MDLTNKIFTDADAAREHLEALQWANGRVCPHCGTVDNSVKLEGASTRPGVYKCRDCRKPFSVTVGTVFERSHIPLNKWLLATHLICASKKGVSAHQLHRMLGVTYKTAWFMAHRIREAMTVEGGSLGGEGKIVEADETYVGGKEKNKHADKRITKGGHKGKQAVLTLVERNGRARSFHLARVTSKTLRNVIVTVVDRKSHLMTDAARHYPKTGSEFAAHSSVNHETGEYGRGIHHSNTVESFFAILKRGVYGTFHHVSEAHLGRYLAEFDFRYSLRAAMGVNDTMRRDEALRGIVGKRLTYRRTNQAAFA